MHPRTIILLAALGAGCGAAPAGEATAGDATAGETSEAARAGAAEDDTARQIAEAELDRLVAEHGARRASVVILDPRDGRLLAVAGRGPFGRAEALRPIEIGSTVKPLSVAAALRVGLDPARRFPGGEWTAGGEVLRDQHPRASLDPTELIVHSSNVGGARLVEAVGGGAVYALLRDLGFDRDLAMGARAELDSEETWRGPSGPRLGTGIGVRTSPVHLAAAYGAIAGDGTYRAPGEGSPRQVMPAAVAQRVRAMLEAAVGSEGTGHRANVPGIRVAGKTGTVDTDAGRRVLFAGLAPAEAPRLVVVVSAEVTEGWGGSVAAPAFARIVAPLLGEP